MKGIVECALHGSLEKKDVGRMDYSPETDFTKREMRSLRLYEEYFCGKYPIIGAIPEVLERIRELPALEDLPAEPYKPPEWTDLDKRKFKKLPKGQVNKVCLAAGFQPLDTTVCVGDLSDAMLKFGRERLEKVCAKIEFPMTFATQMDSDDELAVSLVECALEFNGVRQSLRKGAKVVIVGESGTKLRKQAENKRSSTSSGASSSVLAMTVDLGGTSRAEKLKEEIRDMAKSEQSVENLPRGILVSQIDDSTWTVQLPGENFPRQFTVDEIGVL